MNELIYEQRLGARAMFEIGVPFGFVELSGASSGHAATAPVGWTAGLGDLGFAFKHAVVHSARTGSIVAVGLDVSVPDGARGPRSGCGRHGRSIPSSPTGSCCRPGAFVQVHAGADLPVDFDAANPDLFWRAALGWSVAAHRFGRMYSPMVEVLGSARARPATPP